MPVPITMPQLTDTMTEGVLVRWLKKEGDKVKQGEMIAEVETDKATMEIESFEGGTLAHVAAKEGDKVAVGAILAYLAAGNENPAEVKKQVAGGAAPPAQTAQAPAAPHTAEKPTIRPAAQAAHPPAAQAGQAKPSAAAAGGGRTAPAAPVSGGAATLEDASRGEIHEPEDVGHGATRERPTAVPPVPAGHGNGSGRPHASPLARRMAVEMKIDLGQLKGSGPNGRIIRRDVLGYHPAEVSEPTTSAPGAARGGTGPGPDGKEVIGMTKMRGAIAAALLKSKQTIPHFYETIDIDVEELSKLRERLNKQLEKDKVRLSIADFITKAVCAALVRHPALNARFDPAKQEITRFADVNLGIAVSIPDGLIVPVLRGANRLGLRDIRKLSADLIERARNQRLKQGEQGTGTFTISSLGTFGVREFSAIINPPEVAILAVGSAEKRAVVRGDSLVARTMLTVTLSADHRVVDGATAAEFLQTLKGVMEEPGMMLV